MNSGIKSIIFKIRHKGEELELSAKYRTNGEDLILFIHGLGCGKESFDYAFRFSDFDDFGLLAVDLVGFGDSSKSEHFSYTMEDQSEILRLLLEGVKFSRLHVVAHSMGAAVGLLLAEGIRGKLASFINVEGNLIAEDCGLISRKTVDVSFDEFKNSVFDRLRSKGPKPWRELSAKSDAFGFYKSCESLVEWSDSGRLLEKFRELEANKAYIYGDQNGDMDVLGALGEVRKISISRSGHFVMNDNPEQFYKNLHGMVTGKGPGS